MGRARNSPEFEIEFVVATKGDFVPTITLIEEGKKMHVFVTLLIVLLAQTTRAESLSFPPSYQRLVNDTSASVLLFYQQGNREGLIQLIDRDPLIARKVLLNLLRQPDKLESARIFAELFPGSCDLELEKPLIDFFRGAVSDTRERALDWVEAVTDAEYALEKILVVDRFSNLAREEALSHLHQAAAEFQSLGFVDGEAYCLARWTLHRMSLLNVVDVQSRLDTLEKARTLYEKSGNLRGQAYCLVLLAEINYKALQERSKAAQLFLLACEKGRIERTPIFGHFLNNESWLAEKTSVDWLKQSESQLAMESGLRTTRYHMLLEQDASLEKYRTMLAQEEDPLLKIRAHWELFRHLSEADRQAQALEEADAAIELAPLQKYDMAAYGGVFYPAVPSMLIGRAHSKVQLGMLREAESDYREALRLLEQEASSQADANYLEPVKISALEGLSGIYRSWGEYPLAIEKAREALKLSQPREAGIAWECELLAELYGEMGELRPAEEYLEEASRVPDPYFNAAPIHLAQLHLNFQLYEEALRDLDHAQEGLERFVKIRPLAQKYNWWITQRLRLLTEIWLQLGQPEKALVTAKAVEERNHPVVQGMLGIALMALGRYTEAEKYFQTRLNSLKGEAWPQKEVDAVLNLGKICQARERYGEASSYLKRALELYRQMGNRRGEEEVLLEMAHLANRQNDLWTSDQHSRRALALATKLQDPQGVWSAQYRLAQTALSRGQKREAIQHLEAAVEAMETVSGNIKVDLYKTGFLEDKIQVFDELIALLGPTNPAKAFYYAERRRARAFLESSQRAGLRTTAVPDDLRRRKGEMEARLVGKQKALLEQFSQPASQRNTGLIQSLLNDLKQIREDHTQLMKTVELDTSSGTPAQKEITPLTASQVQQEVLSPGQVLLEYVVRSRETFLFLVSKQVCKFYRLPVARQELAKQIERLQLPFSQLREGRTDLLHLNYDVRLSHELYRLLFEPIESAVQPGGEIIVVPDDVLHYLPLECLSRSEAKGSPTTGLPFAEYRDVDWLVKRFTFVYALSATSLRLRLQQPVSAPRQLLAFGNPSVGGARRSDIERVVLRGSFKTGDQFPEFPPLPQAARESTLIGELMSGMLRAKVFLGDQATESEFFKEAPSADYLHFAAHSLIYQEQPYYSALVLAPDQHSDGLLQAYEIVNTRLQSHLVTLSGCETALGKLQRGEGMLGLQRAFLQAGAESVVVSLWSVEDSTAHFMEAFYRNIRNGQSLAVALRNAKLQYLQGTLALGSGQRLSLSHPFFWAPFVLTTTMLEHP